MKAGLGTTVPLYVILEVSDATKIVRCDIIDPSVPESLASNLVLSPVTGKPGHYRNASFSMPDKKYLLAEITVFESNGTTLFAKDDIEIELFESGSGGGGAGVFSDLTLLHGTLDDDALVGTIKELEQ